MTPQPGPDLDAAVARAIGWTPSPDFENAWLNTNGTEHRGHGEWHPSTDIADALRAADEMAERLQGAFHIHRGKSLDSLALVVGVRAVICDSRSAIVGEAAVPYTDTNGDRLAALALAISLAIEKAGEGEADE